MYVNKTGGVLFVLYHFFELFVSLKAQGMTNFWRQGYVTIYTTACAFLC